MKFFIVALSLFISSQVWASSSPFTEGPRVLCHGFLESHALSVRVYSKGPGSDGISTAHVILKNSSSVMSEDKKIYTYKQIKRSRDSSQAAGNGFNLFIDFSKVITQKETLGSTYESKLIFNTSDLGLVKRNVSCRFLIR